MLAQMVWGTYLEKNCPSSNGHILVFWGSKRLPGWFGALIYRHNGDFVSCLKLVPGLAWPQGARLSAGGEGGSNRYLGNAQM